MSEQPPRANEDIFDEIVGKQDWSPIVHELDNRISEPTQLDSYLANDARAQELVAICDQLTEITDDQKTQDIAQLQREKLDTQGMTYVQTLSDIEGWGGRAMNALNTLTHFAQNELEGHERPHTSYGKPQIEQPALIVDAFSNPGELIDKYAQMLERSKDFFDKRGISGFDAEAELAIAERILAVIYGDKYTAYKNNQEHITH